MTLPEACMDLLSNMKPVFVYASFYGGGHAHHIHDERVYLDQSEAEENCIRNNSFMIQFPVNPHQQLDKLYLLYHHEDLVFATNEPTATRYIRTRDFINCTSYVLVCDIVKSKKARVDSLQELRDSAIVYSKPEVCRAYMSFKYNSVFSGCVFKDSKTANESSFTATIRDVVLTYYQNGYAYIEFNDTKIPLLIDEGGQSWRTYRETIVK